MSWWDWVEESLLFDVMGIGGVGGWMFLSDEMVLDGVFFVLEDIGLGFEMVWEVFDVVWVGFCWCVEGLVESIGWECCWGLREREGIFGILEVVVFLNGGLRSVRREDKREKMDIWVIVERV